MKQSFYEYLPTDTPHQQVAKDNCIALFLVGSNLYGTNTPQSDKDYEGWFIEPPEYVIGSKSLDEVDFSIKIDPKSSRNTSSDIDCKLYGLRKFFKLAQVASPNKIEHLFIPDRCLVYANTKYYDQIIAAKDLFISLNVRHSFEGYAQSQKRKLLTKKKRLEEIREFKSVLENGIKYAKEYLECKNPTIGDIFKKYFESTTEVCTTCNGSGYIDSYIGNLICDCTFRKAGIGVKDWPFKYIEQAQTKEGTHAIRIQEKEFNFGMDAQIILDHVTQNLSRYGNRTLSIDERGYDDKFANHLFRLYYEGIQLLKEGTLTFPLTENKFLLAVKSGEYDLDYLLQKADSFEPIFEMAYLQSSLPKKVKQDEIDNLLVKLYLEYWKDEGWV